MSQHPLRKCLLSPSTADQPSVVEPVSCFLASNYQKQMQNLSNRHKLSFYDADILPSTHKHSRSSAFSTRMNRSYYSPASQCSRELLPSSQGRRTMYVSPTTRLREYAKNNPLTDPKVSVATKDQQRKKKNRRHCTATATIHVNDINANFEIMSGLSRNPTFHDGKKRPMSQCRTQYIHRSNHHPKRTINKVSDEALSSTFSQFDASTSYKIGTNFLIVLLKNIEEKKYLNISLCRANRVQPDSNREILIGTCNGFRYVSPPKCQIQGNRVALNDRNASSPNPPPANRSFHQLSCERPHIRPVSSMESNSVQRRKRKAISRRQEKKIDMEQPYCDSLVKEKRSSSGRRVVVLQKTASFFNRTPLKL